MERKITFNKSGSGSTSGKLIIPVALLEVMGINEDNRKVDIHYQDGKLIIEKIKE